MDAMQGQQKLNSFSVPGSVLGAEVIRVTRAPVWGRRQALSGAVGWCPGMSSERELVQLVGGNVLKEGAHM